MTNELQRLKMSPSGVENQTVNGRTYIPAMGMLNPVHPDDVEGLIAAGWRVHQPPPLPAPPSPPAPNTRENMARWGFHPRPGERVLRLLIPTSCKCRSLDLTICSQPYASDARGVVDAPESDARILAANGGWMILGQAGATKDRPTDPRQGDRFIDLSLEAEVIFDGTTWRHPGTGEEV